MNNNEEYINKLEEINKALESENRKLERSIDNYKLLRNALVVTLASCKGLLYEYQFKNSPKRTEKTEREFIALLKQLKSDIERYDGNPYDISGYDEIRKFIENLEKDTP
jgi:hypothetical protein